MFSNKFDVGIVYVLKVGFIRNNFKFLLIRDCINFFKFFNPMLRQVFFCLYFFDFALFSSIFFQTRIVKLRKPKLKKHLGWGERGLM
jgi:hypothetical protein